MKKRVRKITIVSVISAVAAFAVLGTTAAATGTLNPVFGQMMANEISDGTYSGGNVTVNSDTLNVDFEGVGGDEHNVIATMTVTKKDGTAFAEGTDKLLYAGDKVRYDFEEDMNVTVSRPLIAQITNSDYCDTNGFVDYTFEDDYTLKVTVTYSDDDRNLIGETMNIKADGLYLFTSDKVMYTSAEWQAHMADENDPFWNDGLSIWEKAEKEYGDLAENQAAMLDFDTSDGGFGNVVIASWEKIDLNYDLSVKLNYK